MHAIRTLILLAADRDLRLIVASGPGKGLTELRAVTAADFPDVDVEFHEGRGRGRAGGGGGSHGYGDDHSEAELERGRFAEKIAAVALGEWKAGGYDRIALVAGPKMLGALRDALPDSLNAKVAVELDRDLVKVALHDLPDHLGKVMAV